MASQAEADFIPRSYNAERWEQREADRLERGRRQALQESRSRVIDSLQMVTYLLARSDQTQDHPMGTSVLDPVFAIMRQLVDAPDRPLPLLDYAKLEGFHHGDHEDQEEGLRQAEGQAGEDPGGQDCQQGQDLRWPLSDGEEGSQDEEAAGTLVALHTLEVEREESQILISFSVTVPQPGPLPQIGLEQS